MFSQKEFKSIRNLIFSDEKKLLRNCDVFIVTVPTPIDNEKNPNLKFLKEASKTVGESIKKVKEKNLIKLLFMKAQYIQG